MKKIDELETRIAALEYESFIARRELFKMRTPPKYNKGDGAWLEVTTADDCGRIYVWVIIMGHSIDYEKHSNRFFYNYELRQLIYGGPFTLTIKADSSQWISADILTRIPRKAKDCCLVDNVDAGHFAKYEYCKK